MSDWTQTPPSEPGLYWWCEKIGGDVLGCRWSGNDAVYYVYSNSGCHQHGTYDAPRPGYYAPIAKPEPPKRPVWRWRITTVWPHETTIKAYCTTLPNLVCCESRVSAIAAARAMTEAEGAEFEVEQ